VRVYGVYVLLGVRVSGYIGGLAAEGGRVAAVVVGLDRGVVPLAHVADGLLGIGFGVRFTELFDAPEILGCGIQDALVRGTGVERCLRDVIGDGLLAHSFVAHLQVGGLHVCLVGVNEGAPLRKLAVRVLGAQHRLHPA